MKMTHFRTPFLSLLASPSIPLAALLGLALLAQSASGAGFYFPEIATPSSVGTAGAANPTNTLDSSAVWTNPAGMPLLDADKSTRVGLQLIAPKMNFDSSVATAGGSDGGNAGEATVIPSSFYAQKLNSQLSVGVGVTATMGGGVDYGNNFVGRYWATEASLSGLGFTTGVGYAINDSLSIGGAITAVNTEYYQEISINKNFICNITIPGPGPGLCPNPDNMNDGKLKFKDLDDWGEQYHLGLMYQVTEELLLAFVWRSKVDVDLKGNIRTSNLGGTALEALTGRLELSFDAPEVFEIGARYNLSDDTRLFLEADIENWSDFNNNVIEIDSVGGVGILPRDWDDTWRVAVGAVHRRGAHTFTGGVSFDSSPVNDNNRTADLPVDKQIRFAGGYLYQVSDKLSYNLAAEFVSLGENKLDQTDIQGTAFKGKFDDSFMMILSASLDYKF
jgi:long-chain fatty acid transport protein